MAGRRGRRKKKSKPDSGDVLLGCIMIIGFFIIVGWMIFAVGTWILSGEKTETAGEDDIQITQNIPDAANADGKSVIDDAASRTRVAQAYLLMEAEEAKNNGYTQCQARKNDGAEEIVCAKPGVQGSLFGFPIHSAEVVFRGDYRQVREIRVELGPGQSVDKECRAAWGKFASLEKENCAGIAAGLTLAMGAPYSRGYQYAWHQCDYDEFQVEDRTIVLYLGKKSTNSDECKAVYEERRKKQLAREMARNKEEEKEQQQNDFIKRMRQ